MSVEVISWAPNLAPVPAGRGRQPSTACRFVLAGLANHAVLDSIAEMTPEDRALAKRLHVTVTATACGALVVILAIAIAPGWWLGVMH